MPSQAGSGDRQEGKTLLNKVETHVDEIVSVLRDLVECESPSLDAAAVNRFQELLADRLAGFAKAKFYKSAGPYGRNLLLDFDLPGPRRKKPGRILGVGHGDTVWNLGTLKTMPFRRAEGRIWGPGTLDMKAGLVFFIYALKALQEADVPVARKVSLWVVSDEEVGSEGSRGTTVNLAKESCAALVLEPGTGLEGKIKTARKGVGDYTVRVKGKAAHAGLDFTSGANAIVELSRQIERIAGFTVLKKGITVSPDIISGGTRTNVVAEEAHVDVDMRIARIRDAAPLDKKFRGLKPIDKRCTIEVTGGLNRPPMERTPGVKKLFRTARGLAARELGLKLEESSVGGGSDGNFIAALGVPVLDGIGAVGEGAHAVRESILENRIADRTALLALLVRHLGE
jgi:glutamate carboxypeptidase